MALLLNQPASRPAGPPVVPDADEARQWAMEELSKKAYQDARPGWPEQIAALIKRALNDFLNGVGVANPTIGLTIAAVVVLLAVVILVVIVRPRLNRRQSNTAHVFNGQQVLSAGQHRAMARAAATTGDFLTAMSEQFRAIVRAAEERDLIAPARGRTALEIAAQLSEAFPSHRTALHHGAELFNAVRFGHEPPTADMYHDLLATDQGLAATKPVYPDGNRTAERPAETPSDAHKGHHESVSHDY